MTKEEMIAKLKAQKLQESNALNVTKAEDTIQNIETKEVKDVNKADGIEGLDSELPTQKAVEKAAGEAIDTIIPADKDGVSKDGGDCDKLMSKDGIEAEKKKQDNGMKDVINVSSRKVEESNEVNNELLAQLQEASAREESYKAKLAEMKTLTKEAMAKQAEKLTKEHAAQMNTIFEKVIAEGEKMEMELVEAAAKNEKMFKTAKKLHEGSAKLNKILLEAVKKAQPEKSLTRYVTPARRALDTLK